MSSPRCRIRKRTLDDFIRVLKPGGELILVNHIGAESGPRRLFELAFAPLARRLGWRPEFPWARLTDWAAKHGGVSLTERRPMPPMGHFSLIRFRKSELNSVFRRSMPSDVIRGWAPVRVKKTRQSTTVHSGNIHGRTPFSLHAESNTQSLCHVC